jgi:CheY-specific phosphatase CheX
MTTTFPIQQFRASIREITQAVFETMLSLNVMPLDAPSPARDRGLTAAVYYAGAWRGAILLDCSREQAKLWSYLLTGAGDSDDADIRDDLGELANILAGNLKPLLPPGTGLSIPSVVEGADYRLRLCGGNQFEILDFKAETGCFRVTLVEVRED